MDEKSKTNRGLNRREVLGTGLTGALLLAGYSCLGLKQAVAAARKSGKPLFSADALNALFPNQPNAEYKQLLAEARANPVAFVRAHFTLTDAVENIVNDLEKEANNFNDNDKQGNYRINPPTNDYQDNYRLLTQAIDTAQRENLRIVAQSLRKGCGTAAWRGARRREFTFLCLEIARPGNRGPGRYQGESTAHASGSTAAAACGVIPQQDLPAAKPGLQGLKFAGTLKLTLRRV